MVKHYNDETDPMWKMEVEKLLPWLYGKGADIGCGGRSINKDIIRVDIDKNVNPDIISSGDNLPFKDGELDFITSIHTFEHFEDQFKTLKEWLRVIRKGGIIAIVHPDVTYTKKQLEKSENPSLKENPFNKHYHEYTQEGFKDMLKSLSDLPFKLIDSGDACGNWSFYVILKKD